MSSVPPVQTRRRGGPCGCGAWTARIVASVLALLVLAPGAWAQVAPRSLSLVIGATPGAGVDRTARLMADDLARRIGRPVVVENRPGAAGRIAADAVARSVPDGNTVLFATAESLIDLAFDPAAKPSLLADFVPVVRVAQSPLVLVVGAQSPWTSVDALVGEARRRPDELNYATPGIKSSMHLVVELLSIETHTRFVQIPFIGIAPVLTALVGAHVDFAFLPISAALPLLQNGSLRGLGIASPQRSPLLPNVPTLAEQGLRGVDGATWYAMFVPRATPAASVDELARAVGDVIGQPALVDTLAKIGADPAPLEGAALKRALEAELATYRHVIQVQGIRAE